VVIYTSNYARKGNDPNAIAISASVPHYYKGARQPGLAPTWDFLKPYQDGIIDKEEYTSKYIRGLDSIVGVEWIEWLNALPDPTYFICYESPGIFCHRRLFAEWIEQKCGWVIPEWMTQQHNQSLREKEIVDNILTF